MIHIESVGGGSSSEQPYDTLGGQYSSFSGGTPGFNWGAVGKGFQQAGADIAGSATRSNYMTAQQQPASMQTQAPFNVADQGQVIQMPKTDAEQQAFIDALRRLSEAGKGAAKYWYVDPRAQAFGQDAGVLPYGTVPSL